MTSTFTLPLHCLTCPYQTLQIQWPEPVLLPLAWSGHFQVQVPLLLRHSQPLPKVLLLFPANERDFFLHSTEKWLSLDLKKYTYLLPAISCGVLHTWTCTQRWRTASALARTTTGICTHPLKQISPVLWSDTGKNRKGFAAVWHNFRYSQRYFQRHSMHVPTVCMWEQQRSFCKCVLRKIWRHITFLSSQTPTENSWLPPLLCPHIALHALKLFKSSGLNLFFFHLLGQATFRFKCLCFCTILNHFRRCFSCFLQTSDISSCTLQKNDFHWLEKVYISSACYFMWSASYMDMYTTVTHCKCISKDYYRPLHPWTKTNQPRALEWHWKKPKRLRRCVT